jgi:gamma-glutamylcyclotransferase (GGCT)/AIG2-like uncharacterized protein YtfP
VAVSEEFVPSAPIPCPAGVLTLFVYGTLMSDGCRRGLLAGQRFLGRARTAPGYALLDLGDYPGLVAVESGGSVEGELYEVAAGVVPALDLAEGAPRLYRLRPVRVEGVGGPVYAYFYQPDPRRIPFFAGARWDNTHGGGR